MHKMYEQQTRLQLWCASSRRWLSLRGFGYSEYWKAKITDQNDSGLLHAVNIAPSQRKSTVFLEANMTFMFELMVSATS